MKKQKAFAIYEGMGGIYKLENNKQILQTNGPKNKINRDTMGKIYDKEYKNEWSYI